MENAVKLSAIIDALDMQMEENRSYFDRQCGEVVTLSEEEMAAAEEGDDVDGAPEWQRKAIELAAQVLEDEDGKRFVELPDRFDIDEWRMMESFANSAEDKTMCDQLLQAIHGSGAFGRFKDKIHDLEIVDDWYAFRKACHERIARDWCQDNAIEIQPQEDAKGK